MATRAAEKRFVSRAFGADGERFFAEACSGCHVVGCHDCHGPVAHAGAAGAPGRARHAVRAKPVSSEACARCHRGYFVGADFLGRAPREDHERYQRGPSASGERYLKMLPDVHAERGMTCASCHTMDSLAQGRRSAKGCRDCHPRVSRAVPEHSLEAHLERMACESCHAAWAAQEYGSFVVRPRTAEQVESFGVLRAWGPWRRSAYLRQQGPPPLGLDGRGRVAPIRPQFVLFATDTARGIENRLLAAEWKPFVPHTTRRGSVSCGGCHDSPRRFLLEPDDARLYEPDEDGLPLRSFWSRAGQTVVGGAFLPVERHEAMNRKTPEYVRQHLRQWQNLLDRAGEHSAR
jgi:hypothetical protein